MSQSRARTLATLAASLALVVPACGGNEASTDEGQRKAPEHLSAGEQAALREAQLAARAYCRKLGLYILRRGGAPTASDLQRVDVSLQALIDVGREKPSALTPGQRTIREALGDMLEDIEGSNCPGPLEQKIEQARAALPPQ